MREDRSRSQDCRNTIRAGKGYVRSNAALKKVEFGELPSDVRSHKEISVGCMANPEHKEIGIWMVEFDESVDVGYLVSYDGRKVPIVSNAASSLWPRNHRKMPVFRGKLGTKSVDVLDVVVS